MFVNVGAMYVSDGTDIKTKKALKEALAANPANVEVYDTSDFTDGKRRTGADLEIGVQYSVCGPNPYMKRIWYGTIEKLPNGNITVK